MNKVEIRKRIKQSIFQSMNVMATCDGEIHESEIEILEDYAKAKKIRFKKSDLKVYKLSEAKKAIRQCINSIKELSDSREEDKHLWDFLDCLQKVSQADTIIHKNEQKLLALIHSELGVKTVFSKTKDLVWDEKQLEVINSDHNQRLVISAPPGSGKTELIANQVIRFTTENNINPEHIMLISFTNKAIAEMRDRIAYRTNSYTYPYGIKFLTLDKLAFRVNKAFNLGFEMGEGYSHSLSEFQNLMKQGDEGFIRYIKSFRHIFIDESQDVANEEAESRKSISLDIIDLISNECGVSIYGDEAQKLYPFKDFTQKTLLHEIDERRDELNFIRKELSTIHRTKDPILKNLIEEMRMSIMLFDDDEDPINNPVDRLPAQDLDQAIEDSSQNYLFLFHGNKEIVQASHNMLIAEKNFRLNPVVGKFNEYYPIWLNELVIFFEEQDLEQISFSDFDKFHYSRHANVHFSMDSSEIMWKRLTSFLGENETITLKYLIDNFAESEKFRKQPEFVSRFHGYKGPILSTVHSAKGSQADHVVLSSESFSKNLSFKKNNLKDASVVFVAFTRAKKTASYTPGIETNFKGPRKPKYYHPQRHYEPFKKIKRGRRIGYSKENKIEIGLSDDYDRLSIVSDEYSIDDIDNAQQLLREIFNNDLDYDCYAERHTNGFKYYIYISAGGMAAKLGYFNSKLHSDIANRIKYGNYPIKLPLEPPLVIDGLRILDLASYVASEDDCEKGIHQEYKNRRAWIYPVIYGTGPLTCEHVR